MPQHTPHARRGAREAQGKGRPASWASSAQDQLHDQGHTKSTVVSKQTQPHRTPLSRLHTHQEEGEEHERVAVPSCKTRQPRRDLQSLEHACKGVHAFLSRPSRHASTQKHTALIYQVTAEGMGLFLHVPLLFQVHCQQLISFFKNTEEKKLKRQHLAS